jgi:two-component system, cell cycle sensor histidine kinase and response regulator CckA
MITHTAPLRFSDASNPVTIVELSYRVVWPDGQVRHLLGLGKVDRDGKGQIIDVGGTAQDVTERKLAEDALRESEEKFRTLVNFVPQMVWISTPDGLNTYCNRRWVEYTGMTLEQSYGEGWSVPYHNEDKHIAWDAWNHAVASGERYQIECRLRAADGGYRWFLVQVEPVRDIADKIVKWFGTCTDIEDMKRAEAALREYARVVEGLEEMILVVDRDYRYLLANRAFLSFRGMSAEQVVGQTAEEVVGKEVFDSQVKEKMDECFLGKPVQYELPYDFPKIGRRLLSVSYFPIEGPTGIDRIACVLQDVTHRKLAEEALHQSEERFSKAFRNNPLAITISTEAEGRYLDVNNAFLDLLGYKRQEVIGRTSADLRFWSDPQDRVPFFERLKEKDQVVKYSTRCRTAKGEIRQAEIWAESIELEGKRCVLAITRDVTEMQQLEAQYRQAQKMEAVGRLAGGVAHDFNNIIGIVMGYSDISLGLLAPENPVTRYVTETKKAAQRAALLTRQLLAFSRQQVVFPKILNLNDVVHNVTTMFLRLVGEDIEVEFRPAAQIGSIKADPGQIEQILMNLVVNARDAMPTGGKIIIETAAGEIDEHYVSQHPGTHAGKYVVLTVSDTGCGMDEKTQSQIFEPFFTTKEFGQGTGLGLSTVYGIVKQSDGYILVYSEPGQGTTFKIYFPRMREKAEERVPSREEPQPPRGSETILLVEDDKALRELTAKLLQVGGYRTVEANDAEEALKIMAAAEPEIHLLLTDVVMPGTGGVELVKQARVSHPNLPALFVSGYASDLVALRDALMQESSFLEKPFTKRSLLTKVYALLHGESTRLR